MGKVECDDGRTCASVCDGNTECPGAEDESRCKGNCVSFTYCLASPVPLFNWYIRLLCSPNKPIKTLSKWPTKRTVY